jgi:hypothetical protein
VSDVETHQPAAPASYTFEAGGDVPSGTGPEPLEPARPAAVAPEAQPAAADAGSSLDVPRDTTPTWEVELLVSGAVLFGLFQVPPFILADWAARWSHLSVVAAGVGAAAVLLLLTIFYALIGCFVVHLTLRAYWVALVGTHSVFPRGVRWEKQREYGPIQSRLAQRRVRPLPEFIARVDNAASLVFASGFVMGASVLASALTIGVFGVLLWGAVAAFGVKRGLVVAAAVYFPTMVVLGAAPVIDYRRGGRIDPDSRFGRALTAALQVAQGVLPAGVRSMATVLSSNMPKRVVYAATALGFVGAMGTAMSRVLPPVAGKDLSGASNYRFFSAFAPGAAMPPLRYGNLRGPWEASHSGPSIESEVVTGPYVRLFVPYRPARHNDALPAACPGLRALTDLPDEPTAADRAAADAVLRCAARVHRVRLDRQPVADVRYHFLMDPAANRRGFVAYLPVSSLVPGEHLLEVWGARRPGDTGPDTPYEIPFWK